MKTLNYFCGLLLAFVLFSCNAEPEGTLIKGEIADAANLKIYLDKVSINGANEVLANGPIDGSGNFALGFVDGLESGVYQLRIGAQKALLSLEEGDGVVAINGSLNSFADYSFEVEGSDSSEEMVATMNKLRSGAVKIEELQSIVETTKNPRTAAFIAFNALARVGAQGIPVHKAALARLENSDPMKATYASFVNSLEQQLAMQKSQELIQVGQPAPDITMPSPDGKVYSLSDLKGKVVLLDFWASWCGPCRRENPNVVKVYNKYKDDGFTIFSVSLDGLDARRTQGMSPEDIANANIGQKKRWVDAIAKDNLTWPYHVSELTKWSSSAAQTYGVRGIPKTFMIDKDGKIAAVGLRGAASIEQALKTIL